ncbi:MAG: patatin-like phospholipase family protein [Burkholderiales bacterium]|nr:patatin-like phospholipase family protein [Burkholderiales bacterium]
MTSRPDQTLIRRWLSGLGWGAGPEPRVSPAPAGPLRINLALQGGGAHGAFTWGVLDALLDEPSLQVEGLSGSSAGAMNAVLFADGWSKGGRVGARRSLESFWTEIGKQMPWGLMEQQRDDRVGLSPLGKMLYRWSGIFSPAQLNPFDLNPLRDLLASQVDFERLRQQSPFKLFVGATQASSGKLRIFREHELTVDMMLASACLPKIHHPIQIDGEVYWDGGFTANPPVSPLFYDCESRDLLLVLLNPLLRHGVPLTLSEIEARSTELAFTASFMGEMRMLVQAIRASAAAPAGLEPMKPLQPIGQLEQRLQQLRFHMIDTRELATFHQSDTKLLAYGPFLEQLRDQGRERAQAWLSGSSAALGKRSSIDVEALFG